MLAIVLLCVFVLFTMTYILYNNFRTNKTCYNTLRQNTIKKDKKYQDIIKKCTENKCTEKTEIQITHEWCVNMRHSKSISTACMKLNDKKGKNPKYIPNSVCCTGDYCLIKDEADRGTDSEFIYEKHRGKTYIMKKVNKEYKAVQLSETFSTLDKCETHVRKNTNTYLPLLNNSKVEKICKK